MALLVGIAQHLMYLIVSVIKTRNIAIHLEEPLGPLAHFVPVRYIHSGTQEIVVGCLNAVTDHCCIILPVERNSNAAAHHASYTRQETSIK